VPIQEPDNVTPGSDPVAARESHAAETGSASSVIGAPKRWPKHAVWLGVVISVVGFLSYYVFFARFPDLRDFPIVNLPLVFLGAAIAGVGCWRMFQQPGGLIGKGLAGLGFLTSLSIAGLLSFYVFVLSYQLPPASEVAGVDSTAADFTLPDHRGERVSLSDYRGKKVVLVFYRGFW